MDQQMQAFQIIAKAGDAFSKQMEAISLAGDNQFEKAEELLESAKEDLNAAHQVQTDILTAEAQGTPMETTPIIVHAQDHLTKAMMGDFFVREQIKLYKRIEKLENK
ncbi:PTS lactose/cellobiose transporter subunit IIA [Vagococcus fessus]|uniref:PTS system lactose-specific EIIA component n=1 Tax=Vagococcus fessus TaxID=120370 RepID=A0A430A7N0_9ENTE|nr:PTS lactose/cellobiose transporter subunit IIA [Vagococcus fessus]RSU03081.1 hypothetical protein CBF31_05020 [Vagococcus fessus]